MRSLEDTTPPIIAPKNGEEVLREIGAADLPVTEQRRIVAENAWRLRGEEVRWLNGMGLTDLTSAPPP